MFRAVAKIIRKWKYGEAVIVVSGLPRSGTSMLMGMLEAGGLTVLTDKIRGPDEDNPKGYFEYERVKELETETDASWVREARGKVLKVISHLLPALPDDNYYQVILARRDFAEVLASQNVMLERRGEPNPITDETAIDMYRRHLVNVKALTRSKPNFDLLEVSYSGAVSDPRACAETINSFLGRRLNVAHSVGAVEEQLYRNRKVDLSALALTALGSTFFLMSADFAYAYIGPGAGFAFFGSFFALLMALVGGAISLLVWPVRYVVRSIRRRRVIKRSRVKRMVILGLDGLDPTLTERWIAQGELPKLAALAEQGSFTRLRTTYPSISPVAWSSFMTGVDPARHNIYDFLDRDLRNYKPKLSSSEVRGPTRTLTVGNWIIPLGKPVVRNMRKSRAFWSILGDHGVPCNILRVPLTFPPEKFAGALLSAMCIPDLRGTQGSFTYYTTDRAELSENAEAPDATGGERRLVTLTDGVIEATLPGPKNTIRREGGTMDIQFSVTVDDELGVCSLKIGRRKYRLKEREYSPWIRLRFKAGLGIKVFGIARFYITSLKPHFGLYVTPINIDPGKPALPISWPGFYSVYLSKLIGEFATLGLAEDTWALNERVIDEEAFLKQTLDNHSEREAMFFNAIDKSREGVVACVFDGTDRLQHMFFRYLDSAHPANQGKDVEKYKDTILDMYKRADEMVGRVAEKLQPDDQFLVLSDHGFQSFRRGVNLNSWLKEEGLLHLKDDLKQCGDWFENVDWSRTKAYGFGLGGLYINQEGREEEGRVAPGEESETLKSSLIDRLSGLLDDECGDVAINEVFDTRVVHSSGPYQNNGPDLIVGYNRGYRASWEGAVGRVTDSVITDNTKSWSGDHCVDPRLVPGVLFSNWPIVSSDPGIGDLAPTILDLFGVAVPDHMTGQVLKVDTPSTPA